METEAIHLDTKILSAGVKAVFDKPDHGFYLVAERDQGVVACLLITYEWSDWRNGQFWWIQSVYVSPAHRRRGIFNKLYQTLLEMIETETEIIGLRLYVEQDNITAQNTYLALGMKQCNYRMFEYSKHPLT